MGFKEADDRSEVIGGAAEELMVFVGLRGGVGYVV